MTRLWGKLRPWLRCTAESYPYPSCGIASVEPGEHCPLTSLTISHDRCREEESGRGWVANRLAQDLGTSEEAAREPESPSGPGGDKAAPAAMRITINIGRTELELLRTTNEVCFCLQS